MNVGNKKNLYNMYLHTLVLLFTLSQSQVNIFFYCVVMICFKLFYVLYISWQSGFNAASILAFYISIAVQSIALKYILFCILILDLSFSQNAIYLLLITKKWTIALIVNYSWWHVREVFGQQMSWCNIFVVITSRTQTTNLSRFVSQNL